MAKASPLRETRVPPCVPIDLRVFCTAACSSTVSILRNAWPRADAREAAGRPEAPQLDLTTQGQRLATTPVSAAFVCLLYLRLLALHLTLHLTTARAASAWVLRRSWRATKLTRSHRYTAPTSWFILYELSERRLVNGASPSRDGHSMRRALRVRTIPNRCM